MQDAHEEYNDVVYDLFFESIELVSDEYSRLRLIKLLNNSYSSSDFNITFSEAIDICIDIKNNRDRFILKLISEDIFKKNLKNYINTFDTLLSHSKPGVSYKKRGP